MRSPTLNCVSEAKFTVCPNAVNADANIIKNKTAGKIDTDWRIKFSLVTICSDDQAIAGNYLFLLKSVQPQSADRVR